MGTIILSTGTYDHVRRFVKRTQIFAFCSGVIIGSLLVYFWSSFIGIGFLAGTIASIVNFQIMAADAYEVPGKSPGASRKFFVLHYIVRYAVLFLFFAIIATKTRLNIFAVFVGFFIVQFFLIFERLFQTVVFTLRTHRG